jgi:hypothetical protein
MRRMIDLIEQEIEYPVGPYAKLIERLRSYFDKGGVGTEAMRHWIRGEKLPGMNRLPLPTITPEIKAKATRLMQCRDRLCSGSNVEKWQSLRNEIDAAILVLLFEVLAPDEFRHTTVSQIALPQDDLDIDQQFFSNHANGHMYAAIFDAWSTTVAAYLFRRFSFAN